MATIAVVHLVHRANGVEPLQEFARSYALNPPGVAHELIIAFKGFDRVEDRLAFDRALDGLTHKTLAVPESGLDIGAYRCAAEVVDAGMVCFLNSFSVVLSPGWLAKLSSGLGPSIGAAGASGSWESMRDAASGGGPQIGKASRTRLKQRAARTLLNARFAPFPNPHLRTNAILIPTVDFLQLSFPRLRVKADAHAFESGKRSLTRQLSDRGLGVRVVGHDGVAYEPETWPASRTFRAADQDNLLVADNRTREYQNARPADRRRLAQLSWGSDWATSEAP